ncbi:MAG TPA: hypothetical protein VF210_19115 [Pseudomonadales bacterium]
MKYLTMLFCFAWLLAAPAAADVQYARPSDREVAAAIENVEDAVREFERALDRDFRRSTLRSDEAEVDVENFLKDFQTDIERLSDRFDRKYSASGEATTVLRKANDIDEFVRSQPPSFEGRSEWDVAAAVLSALAAAYETSFPIAAEDNARRINDAELEDAAESISEHARAYRKALKQAFAKEERDALEAARDQAEALSDAAETLRSRIRSGKPASGEAGVVAAEFAALETAVEGRTIPESAEADRQAMADALGKIEQAFGTE